MAVLPLQGASTGKPWSLTRDTQLRTVLETGLSLATPAGIYAGGGITKTAPLAVELEAGTGVYAGGAGYVTTAAIPYSGFGNGTIYLWGLLTRTAADQNDSGALDTYALVLSHTTDNPTPPSALHVPLAVLTVAAGDITGIEQWPAGKTIARARQTVDGWYEDNVPAGQAATALPRFAAGPAFAGAFIPFRGGSITGVLVKSNAARTAGTLTVEVYKNGAPTGLAAILDAANTTFKATTQAARLDTFAAGDALALYLSTDGSWAPVTSDIGAALEVEY